MMYRFSTDQGCNIVEHMFELFITISSPITRALRQGTISLNIYYSEKDGSRPCIYVLNKDELPTLSGINPFVPKYIAQ